VMAGHFGVLNVLGGYPILLFLNVKGAPQRPSLIGEDGSVE
jgi:hypothetical protein